MPPGTLPIMHNAGDQIIVYTGTIANPTFICALDMSGAGWQANPPAGYRYSALPLGLGGDVGAAMTFTHRDGTAVTPAVGPGNPTNPGMQLGDGGSPPHYLPSSLPNRLPTNQLPSKESRAINIIESSN